MDLGRSRNKERTERSREERRSLSESFSEGTSKFFSSVIAKKNGLFSDISSKFETTFLKTSSSSESAGSGEGGFDSYDVDVPPSPPFTDTTASPRPKVRPGSTSAKPKLKTKISPNSPSLNSPKNGNGFIQSQEECIYEGKSTTDTQSVGYPDSGVEIPAGINMSFDEPLYNGRGSDSLVSSRKDSPPRTVDSPPRERVQLAGSYEQSSQSGVSSSNGESGGIGTQNTTNSNGGQGDKVKGKFTKLRRRSSTVDEMLFDDFIEDEVVEEVEVFPDGTEVPVDQAAVFQPIKNLLAMGDLMSFDNDDGAVTGVNGAYANSVGGNLPAVRSQSSLDSTSDAELKGYFSTSVDSSDVEFGGVTFHRSVSMGSEKSWSSTFSTDSQPDELTRECMDFMKSFVEKIFNTEEEIKQTVKAKFGELTQTCPGRLWFARYVNTQRVNNKKVDERIFFRLVQYFALLLFECNEAEDFSPAKSLMNMCFTFFHEGGVQSSGKMMKCFLYSYLNDQPIWQSLRFWNAAFFDAVQTERARRPVCTSEDGNDERTDDRQFQENITFGQLGTFTCNMRAFGLSRELCLEFLRKQCTIANLREEQVQMLKDNVDKWREH